MNKNFFASYFPLIIFLVLILFEPVKWTFYAIRPSDIWLWYCLFQQDYNGYSQILPFKDRKFILYFGLILGIIAIIGTTAQAFYDSTSFQLFFFFNLYGFFRYVLIFKLVENVVLTNGLIEIENFFNIYFIIGAIVVILGFLEYFAIQPYQKIIINLYYERPASTLSDYLIKVERLAGILGNSNATAVLLTTSMIYPIIFLFAPNNKLFKKNIVFNFYICFSLYFAHDVRIKNGSVVSYCSSYNICIKFTKQN